MNAHTSFYSKPMFLFRSELVTPQLDPKTRMSIIRKHVANKESSFETRNGQDIVAFKVLK